MLLFSKISQHIILPPSYSNNSSTTLTTQPCFFRLQLSCTTLHTTKREPHHTITLKLFTTVNHFFLSRHIITPSSFFHPTHILLPSIYTNNIIFTLQSYHIFFIIFIYILTPTINTFIFAPPPHFTNNLIASPTHISKTNSFLHVEQLTT